MQSLTVPLFSGNISGDVNVSLPIVSRVDISEKITQLMNRKKFKNVFPEEVVHASCRELFQEGDSEIFFFPKMLRNFVSLRELTVGSLCFLKKGHNNWGFVFCFTPSERCSTFFTSKCSLKFKQKDDYPEGVDNARFFYFSPTWVSVLVSQYGFIKMNNEGKYVLQGIEVALLQRPLYNEKVLFLQRKNIVVSPISPLREEGLVGSKFIKISCFCKNKNFCYSAKFPVLTKPELEKKLQENRTMRLLKYGVASSRYKNSSLVKSLPASKPGQCHLIVVPRGMGINVPFEACIGGEIFFVHSEHSLGAFQLVFLPRLFDKNLKKSKAMPLNWESWHIKDSKPSIIFLNVKAANLYFIPFGKLVQCSGLEFKLVESKIEMVASKIGSWGVFLYPEDTTSSSVSNPHTQKEGRSSPIPGPSGIGRREATASLSQEEATVVVPTESESPVSGVSGRSSYVYGSSFPSFPRATVAVSSKRQGQQTQQKGKSSPMLYALLLGSSGIGHREATASLSQEKLTVAVPPESENPQTQQKGSKSPVSGVSGRSSYAYGSSLPRATVSVSSKRQGQQTQQKSIRNPVPGPSGIRYHPYFYGPRPFYGGLYSYRSPITPHPPKAAAIVSIPPGRQKQQTQKEGKSSPILEPSGIGRREATASLSQEKVTVAVPPESENPQTQQKGSKSPVSGVSGRSSYAYGSSFPRATVVVSSKRQGQQTQQKSIRNPVPGPSGVERREATASLSQEKVTVAVPPESENPQTQQKGSKSPVSGVSGRSSYAYGSSFPSFPRATVVVSSKRQGQQTQQKSIRNPVPGPSGVERREATASLSQEKVTVAVPPESENPQTQQKGSKSPVSGVSGRSSYAYGSSFPSFPRATVVVSSKRQGQQTQQKSIRNPVPGPSGVERREATASLSQEKVTVAVPPESENPQTQQKGSKSPVSGVSGRSSYAYGSSFPSFPRATVVVSSKRQGQQTQQKSIRNPVPGPSGVERREATASLSQEKVTVAVPPESENPQTQQKGSKSPVSGVSGRSSYAYGSSFPRATVVVSSKRQGQQTQQKSIRNPVPGPSGVRHHPYFYGQLPSYPYGPLPFCEGLYSYRSPIIPHSPQAEATVSIPPGRQGQQTQQEGRSSPPGPSGIGRREATASLSQAEATVAVSPERQRQQTQQEGRSSPHGRWPFSREFHPYFYPRIGSFFRGSYPYGSPLPPCPYPAARKDQWMPVFPPFASAVRPPVAPLEPLRYDISEQKEGVGHSGRKEEASASVPVESVQQTSMWRLYEASSSTSVPSQVQAKKSDEDTDIDVED